MTAKESAHPILWTAADLRAQLRILAGVLNDDALGLTAAARDSIWQSAFIRVVDGKVRFSASDGRRRPVDSTGTAVPRKTGSATRRSPARH